MIIHLISLIQVSTILCLAVININININILLLLTYFASPPPSPFHHLHVCANLFPPTQARPRVTPLLLSALLRTPSLRIPPRTPRVRALRKVPIVLLLLGRRPGRGRRGYIALRHVLAPLILLLLLLGRLAPGLVLLVLRWRWREELLMRRGRGGVVLMLGGVVGLACGVLVRGLIELLVGLAAWWGWLEGGVCCAAVGLLGRHVGLLSRWWVTRCYRGEAAGLYAMWPADDALG